MSEAHVAPSRGYAKYLLGTMFVATLFNVADRDILVILLEPIKTEFGASDTAMGVLSGVIFGAFHAVESLPIAYYADRSVRHTIVAVSLFLWSGLTAMSGLVQSYLQLAIARIGVSMAESG